MGSVVGEDGTMDYRVCLNKPVQSVADAAHPIYYRDNGVGYYLCHVFQQDKGNTCTILPGCVTMGQLMDKLYHDLYAFYIQWYLFNFGLTYRRIPGEPDIVDWWRSK